MSLIDLYGKRDQQSLLDNSFPDGIDLISNGNRHGLAPNPEENFYVRLTGKDTGNTPIKYAWQEVIRLDNNTWSNLTTHYGNATNDPAY